MSRTPVPDTNTEEKIPLNKYTVLKDQYGTKNGVEVKLAIPGQVVQGNDVVRPDGHFVQTVVSEVPIRIPWADVKPFETNVASTITQGLDTFFAPLAKNTVFTKVKGLVDGAITGIDPLYTIPTIMAGWGVLGYAAHKGWKTGSTTFKVLLFGLAAANTYITYRLARNVQKCKAGNQKVFNAIGDLKRKVGGHVKQQPMIFTETIYRMPTKSELNEVHGHDLDADQLIKGFIYTMVGKGIHTPTTEANILGAIAELHDMYPDREVYLEALMQYAELSKKLMGEQMRKMEDIAA